jgi:hypothetical protein
VKALKFFGFLTLTLMSTACAGPTREAYEAQVQSFIGRPLDELALNWGPPQGSYVLQNGDTLVEYSKGGETIGTGSGTSVGLGGFRSSGGFGTGLGLSFPLGGADTSTAPSCKTRFTVSPDRVVRSYSLEGTGCTAYPPKMPT